MTRTAPCNPLIAIVGSTGTGKSELAVEIARRYGGEIINGDAMQLYAGLPIITNKITVPEQKGIPHHLLGCIGLEEQTWVVGMFVQRALKTIDDIRSRGRLPILVGGTHYYTQSLLFHDRLASRNDDNLEEIQFDKIEDRLPLLQEPTDVILAELRKVDPAMADRWHPNDRRKIQRSLEIFLKTGRKASDIYAEQREHSKEKGEENTDNFDSGGMRFPTVVFWVHSEPSVLQDRLNLRVDKMLANGLLDEIQDLDNFAASQAAAGQPVDESRGIWVSIGYKEFKPYLSALQPPSPSEDPVPPSALEILKLAALERTKITTRQYAKSQSRWLRIKFTHALVSAGADENMFLLDASDVDNFQSSVVGPALELTEKFLKGETLPQPESLSSTADKILSASRRECDLAATPEKWVRRECEVCGKTCVTEEAWTMHVKSKAHRKLTAKKEGKGRGRGREERVGRSGEEKEEEEKEKEERTSQPGEDEKMGRSGGEQEERADASV